MRCRGCEQENPADSLFCGSCGASLRVAQEEIHGERRQLTVMFCDIVGSSALAGRLDPEDLQYVVAAYYEMGADVIERFGGYVAQYLGDGILAYFSYPEAHEDDAERAVRAGLGILAELEALNPRLESEYGIRLPVRIGIHTGTVVMGDLGGGQLRETLALGQTVNLASRLQHVAERDSVVMSSQTLRLVRGLFVTEDLGLHSLAGFAEPVALYRAVQPSGMRSRFDVAAEAGLTRLVGREDDLAMLLDRWHRVREGHGCAVLIGGEAGIGKSRLVHALRDLLAADRHTWLECHGSPHHQNSALHPIIELLGQGLHLARGRTPEERIARVERGLDLVGLPLAEIVPLLAALLALPLPERYAPLSLGPEAQRRRTLEALAAWLYALAKMQPTVLVMEDLHWTDPSTLELLGSLIARVESAPVLLIGTFRPSFEPTWGAGEQLVYMAVKPLTRRQSAAMVEGIEGGEALPRAVRDDVVGKTDGVPLFIEELTKSVLESGLSADGEPLPSRELEIPSTLQDSLTARLDRLGPAKEVAQVAAVLGREFSYDLLAAVSGADAPSLEQGLSRLATAGLVYEVGALPYASYTFKHMLVQETAYQSLLKATRRSLHERSARVLEERFPERIASEPEAIARHCEKGGLIEAAISYYQRAGERATQRSASAEAVGHLKRALELLRGLPESPRRDESELVLQVSLGALLAASRGWGSPEAVRAYGRARELCERIGRAPQLFRAIRGLITFYVARADLVAAHDLCEQLLHLAESEGAAPERLIAHQQMAILLYFMGNPSASLERYERAIALHDPAKDRALTLRYGEHLGVFVRIWMAWTLWILGHPDRAVRVCREAVQLGREAGHPFSLAYALLWAAVVHVMRRERQPARELAEAAMAIAEEEGFAFVLEGGRLVRVWSRLDPRQGNRESDRAIAEFRQALAKMGTTGSQVSSPMILGDLATACLEMGRHRDAQATAEAALALSRKTHQPYWDAELLRIRAEALLGQQGAARNEAECLMRQALDLARSQKAKSHELRVAVSLGRLWQEQGRAERARELLAPIYDSFSEGFDTPDLKDARALLEQLS
jgi:predicted ATPase/class 3 adenylate cyclase